MKITSDLLRGLGDLGLTVEQVAGVVSLLESRPASSGAERQKRYRDRQRNVTRDVTTVTGDVTGDAGSPLKEIPPTPPKENNPLPTCSEADASSQVNRAGTTSAPMARLEFDSEFWPRYPNKVGKPKALEAFIAARRKATLPEILDGLARYKSDKPPDRQWLNPATFLNQERWNDEPAPRSTAPDKPRPHDAIFEALARRASAGGGHDERPADVPVGVLDYRGSAA